MARKETLQCRRENQLLFRYFCVEKMRLFVWSGGGRFFREGHNPNRVRRSPVAPVALAHRTALSIIARR
jgi:hypothetical protein